MVYGLTAERNRTKNKICKKNLFSNAFKVIKNSSFASDDLGELDTLSKPLEIDYNAKNLSLLLYFYL